MASERAPANRAARDRTVGALDCPERGPGGAVRGAGRSAERVAAGLRLEDLAGLARRAPWTFVAFVICGLSLIGIPGTAGFISKWYLITAALEFGAPGLVLVLVILVSSLMAVAYIWRIVEAAAFAPVAQDVDDGEPQKTLPLALLVATWAVALANIFFGLVPALPLELSASAADILLGHMR